MDAEVVALKGITHHYTMNWALADVSFSVRRGEGVAILGPNGCGKSTLLKILATRLMPTRGEGTILGLDLKRDRLKIRAQAEWLGHELGLYPALTAEENLKFACALKGKTEHEKISAALAEIGLTAWKDKAVASFSIGMRKRLVLARILLGEPQLILLDEPHTNLDQKGRQWMTEHIAIWKKRGWNLFLASHDHPEVIPLCDKALVLNQGRITYFGDSKKMPADILL